MTLGKGGMKTPSRLVMRAGELLAGSLVSRMQSFRDMRSISIWRRPRLNDAAQAVSEGEGPERINMAVEGCLVFLYSHCGEAD